MPRVRRQLIPLLLACLLPLQLGATVTFEGIDLDDADGLLFRARVLAPRFGEYVTGFMANSATGAMEAISFFPEQAAYFPATQELQIQNRFGVYRVAFPFTRPKALARFPGFANGAEVSAGKLSPATPSPDGRWIVYLRPQSPAFASLVLFDQGAGTERTISQDVAMVFDRPSVLWAPGSDVVIYEKDNELYYYSLNQAKTGRVLDEKLRHIGPGQLSSIAWGDRGQIQYIQGSMVYEILVAELFTRSLYRDFLQAGKIIGRLPHQFDPNFDRFALSPDSRVCLLSKGSSWVYLYPMNEESHPDGKAWELPFLAMPRSARLQQVVWTSDNRVSLVLQSPNQQGVLRSLVYRLDLGSEKPAFVQLDSPLIRQLDVQGTSALVRYIDRVALVDLGTWKISKEYLHPDPLHAFRVGSDGIVILGSAYAEYIQTSRDQRDFLFFTQAAALGYDAETGLPSIQSADKGASYSEQRWLPRQPLTLRPPSTANSRVRAYAEELHSGAYRNIIMLRRVKEVGTSSLFKPPVTAWEPFPANDEAVDMANFTHGSRIRGRLISLSFNAIDSAEGLDEILAVLDHYKVRASFFVNGEFMRRYPAAVKELARSGQEVGSMFYTWFNLADQRYRVDTEFLKQGLARNEDEYREITGKELSSLWRTPYYVVNRQVLEASAALRYTLVGTDVDSLDAVTLDARSDLGLYKRSAKLVEDILARKRPGSIITLTVGKPGEHESRSIGRDDYLFQKLDVLINALLQKGYSIVPVSRLIEAAR